MIAWSSEYDKYISTQWMFSLLGEYDPLYSLPDILYNLHSLTIIRNPKSDLKCQTGHIFLLFSWEVYSTVRIAHFDLMYEHGLFHSGLELSFPNHTMFFRCTQSKSPNFQLPLLFFCLKNNNNNLKNKIQTMPNSNKKTKPLISWNTHLLVPLTRKRKQKKPSIFTSEWVSL